MDSKDTNYWVKQLSHVQLPVLSGVMKDINAVTQNSESSAEQLSEIILRDSALTAKVLRLANSVANVRTGKISTISRAVVQLGFKGIKAISLSVMLVDSLLKNNDKTRMMEWMARGFHTAVQAESLIKHAGGGDDEEVFITALLLHVGDMAFWSMKGQYVNLLDGALNTTGEPCNEALEEKILGSSLKDVGIALVDEWNLGDDLKEVLSPGHKPSMRTQAVLLGEKLSLAAEKGWDSPEFTDALVDASMFTGLGLQDMRAEIIAGAEKASEVAKTFGAERITAYIPKVEPGQNEDVKAVVEELVKESAASSADPKLQLEILRDMGNMIENNIDVNTLFNMLTEGVHRGVGLERVALCLIDPRATSMAAKYVLGDKTERWREDFKFPVKAEQDNLFSYCLFNRQVIWLKRRENHELAYLINKKMHNLLDVDNCLVASVYTGKRTVGILVADRGSKGASITDEQYESFQHFAQQANNSLAMLAANANKRRG